MTVYTLVNQSDPADTIRLTNRPVTFGRHPDNDVVVVDDLTSRFHCVIEPIEGGAGHRLRDLGSRNGTRVNDRRVEAAELSVEDVVKIGSRQYVVQSDVPAAAAPRQARAVQLRPSNGGKSDTSIGEPPAEAAAPVRTKPSRPAKADAAPAVLPKWAAILREIVEILPPRSSADIPITLIDARGETSEALAGYSPGAVAVRLMLLAASKSRATDVHMEPRGETFGIRIRVDGQMVRLADLPNEVGVLALGLIRSACLLKSAARDAVQDGHFSARVQQRRVDYRASFTPSLHGQKLVVRVLDLRDTPTSLSQMNMAAYMLDRIKAVCEQSQGMVLVCGPTGSGKTTTLYNAMRAIDREHRNVITIEDPVEYHLEGVTQIPADEDRGNSFGNILRSVLRQDPDVILVGEIRDDETARTAMRAAMTGHLVFSTVHSKDSIGAVFRLLDLGVEPYLVANSLDLVVAQRLVRVLCPECKQSLTLKPGSATRMGRFASGVGKVFGPVGCKSCLGTGYWGRAAIFEMLSFNDELRDVVLHQPTIQSMKRVIEQGLFTTLQQSGWQMVARGDTSIEEVERVTGQQ